jgi:cell division protease FtsH
VHASPDEDRLAMTPRRDKRNLFRALAVLVGIVLGLAINLFLDGKTGEDLPAMSYSEFRHRVAAREIERAVIQGDVLLVTKTDGSQARVVTTLDLGLMPALLDHGVMVEVAEPPSGIWRLLVSLLPTFIIVGVLLLITGRSMRGGLLGLGKSKAQMLEPGKIRTRFTDVAGIDEFRAELEELQAFLTSPKRFQALGAEVPRGVLLEGAPGVGKTLLARALAGETGVPFFSLSGSDFVEMFVGVGASRVRDLFARARKAAPAIVFIDEIDAIGRRRSTGHSPGNEEREQTLNQILVEMDGFNGSEGVIVLAATNRPDILDPALLRPGRFDRRIAVLNPDLNGRRAILNVVTRQIELAADVDLDLLARLTPGFTGAALKALFNEAALIAGTERASAVSKKHIELAFDRAVLGKGRGSLVVRKEERRITAYQEAGHALVATLLPASDPVHKATILPHGRALGLVVRKPEEDHFHTTRAQIDADLTVTMAGRAAEGLVFAPDQVTAGAAADIARANQLARRMVCEWGMDEIMGPLQLPGNGAADNPAPAGESTRTLADQRVRATIEAAEQRAAGMLERYRAALEALAQALLERKTLDGEAVRRIVAAGGAAAAAWPQRAPEAA